jgi:uncharacterized repeat protein (TIGR03803 family)
LYYGTASAGGYVPNGGMLGTDGIIFSFNPANNQVKTLWKFGMTPNDANTPSGNLVYDPSKGLYYGISWSGGAYNYGTIYSFNPANDAEKVLYSFGGSIGDPTGTLVYDPENELYYFGGAGIFSFNPANDSVNLLWNFHNAFVGPNINGLLFFDGAFYGMTDLGGTGFGTIYRFDPNSNPIVRILHNFAGQASDGAHPNGNLTPIGNLLYGVTSSGGTSNNGTLFSFDTAGNTEKILHNFASTGTDGEEPIGTLLAYPPNPNTINIQTIATTSYCAGASIQIPFYTSGFFDSTNIFKAELSSSKGSFAGAITIGTLKTPFYGTINAVIPANTAPGTGYKIRIVSTKPRVTGTSYSKKLTINAVPDAAITSTGSLCNKGKDTLTVASVTGDTYAWSTAATTNSISVRKAGTYTVTVTSSTGCSASASEKVVACAGPVNNTTDNKTTSNAEPVSQQFQATVYPNPYTGQFHIKIQSTIKNNINIKVYDVNGRQVEEQANIVFGTDIILGSNYAAGVYIVRIEQGEISRELRVVKAE